LIASGADEALGAFLALKARTSVLDVGSYRRQGPEIAQPAKAGAPATISDIALCSEE
jgi:hypothetical protein